MAHVGSVGLQATLPSCFSPRWGRRERQAWSNGSGWQKKCFREDRLLQGQRGGFRDTIKHKLLNTIKCISTVCLVVCITY